MKTFATIAGLLGLVSAHMEMSNPPPFRSKFNDFTTDVDYSMTSPLDASGSNYPCKGYHNLMGTPQGKSVTTYEPGQTYQFTISGSTIHNGGSCQASLSYDGGESWTVIHSYIGNCPLSAGDTNYDFTIPNDTPGGEALFGWTWFNNVGNREMYMNCAVVTIGGGSGKRDLDARGPGDSFSSRPAMFVANVDNGCGTKEGSDVEFPNPGPDVTRAESDTAPPTGNCPGGKSSGGGGGGGSAPEPAPEPQPEPEPAPEPSTTPGGVFIPVPTEQPTQQPTTFMTQTRTKTEPEPTNPPENDDGGSDEGDNEGGNEGGEGTMEPGSSCDNEGQWNCVGGKQFQRCASGNWSVLQGVYPGTTCVPGKSDEFLLARSKAPSGNYRRVVRDSRKLQQKK